MPGFMWTEVDVSYKEQCAKSASLPMFANTSHKHTFIQEYLMLLCPASLGWMLHANNTQQTPPVMDQILAPYPSLNNFDYIL